MPIKPRGERGNRWLRYLFAVLLLAVVVGGGAFAVTRFLDDDDNGDPTTAQAINSETPEAAADNAQPTATASESEQTPPPDDPEPTATAEPEDDETEPTQEPEQADSTEEPADSNESEAVQAADEIQSAGDLLPTEGELEGSWTVAQEGDRSRDEVGAQLGTVEEGVSLLSSWSWRENLYRDFNRSDSASFAEDATFLSVSVHRFASQEGAAQALTYFSDIVVSAQGLLEVDGISIGDSARGLEGPGEGVNLYVLYVRDGNYVIRLGGSSVAGDPAPFVDSVAEQIVSD